MSYSQNPFPEKWEQTGVSSIPADNIVTVDQLPVDLSPAPPNPSIFIANVDGPLQPEVAANLGTEELRKAAYPSASFAANLLWDLLDVFGTMSLGALFGGSLVLGVGILYDHLKANSSAISQVSVISSRV
jgi:hypothetical protein